MAAEIIDYDVTVCAECLQASCWHGEFMCDKAQRANVTTRKASELRALGREHPDHFSPDKIRALTGEFPKGFAPPPPTAPVVMPAEAPPRAVMERILIEGLAHVIEPDRPPGLAAHTLARSVVALVRDRGGPGAALLALELDLVDQKWLRGPG